MKTTAINLINENIQNLTSLWRSVGEKVHTHKQGTCFDYGIAAYSEWPNRLWFHGDIEEESLNKAIRIIRSAYSKIMIPYWDIYESNSHELFKTQGFEKQSEQVGMSLKLTHVYDQSDDLELKTVSGIESALLWERLFHAAFGYRISHKLLLPHYEDTQFLIASHGEEPVGTVILHNSNNSVAGVHAMGIIPEKRRKGYAEQIMRTTLNRLLESGFTHATLQASAMGKGLYLKLGFAEQFNMKNYTLSK